jgi:hypothetical protein
MLTYINEKRASLKPTLWVVFILYALVSSYTISRHELWSDELHSWNIAKASNSFSNLIYNTRYEGHPPVWYTVLWSISKFTHNVNYIQAPQLIVACLVVFIVLFFSPFPLVTRILIPFGYYFLFEYAVFSRNYAIGLLPAFCVCFILRKSFRFKSLLYYALLFFMSNTHLLAAILAGSLHLYFLLWNIEQKKKISIIISHVFAGILIFLPALYFISPPEDSQINMRFWIDRLNIINQMRIMFQAPLRAFIPIPAWWKDNFWNTEFLLEAQSKYTILKFVSPLVFIILLTLIFFILKDDKKSLILFGTNLLLTFIVAGIYPLIYARYVGFIFLSFIAACWLYSYEKPIRENKKLVLNILLTMQLIAGVFAVSKDIRLPFSNLYRVDELVKEVSSHEKIITDYWCLNTLEAYTDKPFYCIELQKEMSFILWNKEFATAQNTPNRFFKGVKNLFEKEGIKKVYMISIHSTLELFQLDSQLSRSFSVKLIDKREGAIEKGSNLYLYQISVF